jgi:hypothetical protein
MKKNKLLIFEIILFLFFLISAIVLIIFIDNKSNQMAEIRRSNISVKNELTEAEKYQKFVSKIKKPTKEIKIAINDEQFDPSIINIKKGEKILFKVAVREGYHNLIIDPKAIYTRYIPTNQNDSIYFLATRSGSLKIYSNTGRYLVEPKGEIIIYE